MTHVLTFPLAVGLGDILVARGRSPQRRRFSIAHELGHFLTPAHLLPSGEPLPCSAEQLRLLDENDQNRRRRMEAAANRFAALLLVPPPVLRAELQRIRRPVVGDIVWLAKQFNVSKEAMARCFVDSSREAVAIDVICNGRVLRYYRNARYFPWIAIMPGMAVPEASSWHDNLFPPGVVGESVECEPETWLDEAGARGTLAMSEHQLGQSNG